MNQRGRNRSNYDEYSGGSNILFTLGLISVVALLVVGFVMTQGGIGSLADKGLTSISLSPTPIPLQPTPAATAMQVNSPSGAQIREQYEKEMARQKDMYEKRIEELRKTYETQITDLKTQLQLLDDENKMLRKRK
ncbi:MAG: hypothetical protein ACE15F_16725 [bacterium]